MGLIAVVVLMGAYSDTDNSGYAYQVNIHENLDSANPVKANIYVPNDKAIVTMKLETERYQMYGTTGYVDDINQGNHNHIMLNEITKWDYPKNLSIKINGQVLKTFNDEQINTEIDLPKLQVGWNAIEFSAESDGRINVSIFVTAK